MATFPLLSTGAVAQYPSSKRITFSTSVVRYLDGSEQRFRLHRQAVERWEIRMSQISEEEADVISAFFSAQDGRFGSFSFVDPWTGIEHTNCSFDEEELEIHTENPVRSQMTLTIRNNNA